MSERPNRAEAVALLRAHGGYEGIPDEFIHGTTACALLELRLAVRDAGRALGVAMPAVAQRHLEAWRLARKPPEHP